MIRLQDPEIPVTEKDRSPFHSKISRQMAAGLFAGYLQSAHTAASAINGSRQEAIMQQVMTLPGIEENGIHLRLKNDTTNWINMYKLPILQSRIRTPWSVLWRPTFAVVTGAGSDPVASHLPLHFWKQGRKNISRATWWETRSPQSIWKNNHVLVIFNGPHCFVSARMV